MDAAQHADRRRPGPRPGVGRRLLSALVAGLYRPLAGDDDRVAYWVRHVRHGVVLSELCAVAVLVYAVLTPTPVHHDPLILWLAAGVILASPVLLVLPWSTWLRDARGVLVFYEWSIAVTAIVTVVARRDGGSSSPLFALLFITLAYMAAAYPPHGVVVIGSVMTGSYLLFVALPDLTLRGLFFAVVMAAFTMLCTLASANSWAAYDRQVELIRTSEALAQTDPLTGCPNRRAFLDRLAEVVEGAGPAPESVVCLVDLDGFKAVNDREGHAAGDAVLVAVAAALSAAVREGDIVARLGGDEFAVLAEVAPDADGALLAERLRDAVADAGRSSGVTASVGVSAVGAADDVHDLLYRADSAMYRAKTAGGNRVTALSR